MTGVPRCMAKHWLNVQEGCPTVRQKKRGQAPDRNKVINKEVTKLVEAEIMRGVHYHSWIANPILVKKSDNSWRMYVDCTDLNKSCLKDCYSFWRYTGRATYYHLVDKAFEKQIGRNLVVYVDDLIIKIHTKQEVLGDMEETFQTLRRINMKLNPKKCTFCAKEGMFLGHIVDIKGIKVCLEKAKAVAKFPS
ncbi:reverse transcriptase domain-containing protein [Tanacetum coccineum]